MQLCFVRHGETEWNLQGRYQGRADPPLCAAGAATARGIAEQLNADAHLLLVSSPLQRATATAALVATACGAATALPDARLGEIDFGASRMSSVLGLKASPHSAIVLPLRSGKCAVSFSNSRCFCRSLTASTACSSAASHPTPVAERTSALTSFGKHEPPYPTPG